MNFFTKKIKTTLISYMYCLDHVNFRKGHNERSIEKNAYKKIMVLDIAFSLIKKSLTKI